MFWILLALIVILSVLLLIGAVFFQFTFTREGFRIPGKPHLEEGEYDLRSWKRYMDVHMKDHDWYLSLPKEPVTVSSQDGLKLYGEYAASENPKRIIICVHGYRGEPAHDFASVSRFLLAEHSDLLFIDQRASNHSEGRYVTFGAKEKTDIKVWVDYVQTRNPEKLPVYLYGISMGCATVLCASDQGIEQNVNGIIADCGYSSIRSILETQAKNSFHMPPYPVLTALELFAILRAGFRFSDGDAEAAMKKNRIPVVFLHGTEDHFVRPENTLRSYEACEAEKDLVMIEDAVHASSYNTDPDRYQAALKAFFSKQDGSKGEHA